MSFDEDDEVMREFLLESAENLDRLDRDFVVLEQTPRDPARLAAIFRCVHTIKGNAGFLALSKLEQLAHVGESQLSRFRDGELTLDTRSTSALLAMADAIRSILASLEKDRTEGDGDFSAIIEELSRIGEVAAGTQPSAASLPSLPVAPVTASLAMPEVAPAPVAVAVVAPLPPAAAALEAEAQGSAKAAASSADSTIRVDVGLLDRVMNLVGELVLARNQIVQYGMVAEDAGFIQATQRLNLLTSELQAGVMKTRMQPIGSIWNRFPRIVRDLANVCGKKVDLELDGTETELDRSIIEAIKDPLTHALRNAVDHGIERSEQRRAAGKPAVGRIVLRAYHEGGQVNIEISDDGAGLQEDKIRARAVERGLIAAERAGRMSEREVAQLIFLPGFSTADAVSNVSGRGVGMDVVKTNIEKIGGTVDISSRRGEGSTLKIKIPLTLAIIEALVVTSGGERFAIPQVNLLALVRLEGAQALRSIETLHGTTLYRLRGKLLPLLYLNRTLQLSDEGAEPDACNIVILQADDRQFGIVVDRINDTSEIVVKPLGKELKGLCAFAGATIMGDGRVALILDVLGIAQRGNVVSPSRDRAPPNEARSTASELDASESLLLFRVGATSRMVIPLSMVARLEEIAPERVERAAGRDVVQYRGELLPLVYLSRELLGEKRSESPEPLLVIVYAEPGRSVGLVVEQILDIVEEVISVRSHASREGLLGSIVVQGRVADVLDVRGVIGRADGSSLRGEAAA
jgi:two-component system, chemotaxis family, sensor kinase CheA